MVSIVHLAGADLVQWNSTKVCIALALSMEAATCFSIYWWETASSWRTAEWRRLRRSLFFPIMDKVGVNAARLAMVIITHPDLDHQEGNAAIRGTAPGALIACGEADRQMEQDPDCLYRERCNYLQKDHGLGFGSVSPDAGKRCRVDVGFHGGEHIVIADGWELEVLHVPGHSYGHLALLDRERKTCVSPKFKTHIQVCTITRVSQSKSPSWGQSTGAGADSRVGR
jgi:hypothetical protein